MSNSNFENQIKQSVERFDELPSDGVWDGLNQKLNQNPMKNNNQLLRILSLATAGVLLVAAGYFFLKADAENRNSETPTKIENASCSPLIAKTFPELAAESKKRDQPVFLFLKNEDCRNCENFENEVLENKKVKKYLSENFVSKTVNADEEKYSKILETFNIEELPSMLIVASQVSLKHGISDFDNPKSFLNFMKESMDFIIADKKEDGDVIPKNPLVQKYFKEELEVAKIADKGLAVYVCMEYCKPCKKFQHETLNDPTVSAILDENFVFVTVDLLNDDFKPFYKEYGVNASPMMLFFNNDGAFIEILRGFRTVDFFTEFLNEVIQKSGEIAPIQTIEIPKETIPTAVKIFPNPTDGPFTLQIKSEPVTTNLRMFDINGKEILFEDLKFFDGVYEQEFDLSEHPKGTYIFQVSQRGNLITEKVLIQ